MAKKKTGLTDIDSLPSVLDIVKKVDDTAEIIAESAYSNIKEWIPSGNYILNACMSGDLFKAIPTGRVISYYGPSSVGKTFLACSGAREAQKMGYTVIYMDSEGAVDAKFVARLGVDPTKLIIKQVSTIAETSQFIASICKGLQEQEDTYGMHQKVMFVLDSLGNLTSDKERDDTISGNNKRDMTKAQELKALFRVNATPLAKLQCPMVVCNHSYAAIGSYIPTQVQAGGSSITYNASITIELSAAKLVDNDNDKKAKDKAGSENAVKNGVLVTAKPVKSRFCRPIKIQFSIPYFKEPNPYVGLERFMTWENSGVVRGSLLTEKEYSKLSETEKSKVYPFEYNGETMYCQPKDTARGIVVKHLGRQVPFTEFWSSTVFTQEYLEFLNENVIKPMFSLPDHTSFEDIQDIENTLEMGDDVIESSTTTLNENE